MRYKDGKIEQITHNRLGDMHATPNSDGSVIVWDRFSRENANDPEGRWQVILWKDGKESVLTENTGNCLNPTLSSNGQVAAWVNDLTGNYAQSVAQYYTVKDGQTHDLSYPQEYAYPPSISADGSRIFFRLDNSDGAEIWMKDQDDQVKPVTDSPNVPESSVVTTADGKTVFYSVPGPEGDDNLYRLDTEPWKLSTVSDDPKSDETWCSTSSDGGKVAWTNFERSGQDVDIQIMLREGDKTVPVTQGDSLHSFPHMSADGNALVYMDINPADTNDVAICLWRREG